MSFVLKQTLLRPVLSYFHSHFAVFLYAFDPVKEAPPEVITLNELAIYRAQKNNTQTKINGHFAILVLFPLYLACDTARVYFQSKIVFSANPAYITHRMYSIEFWAQGDMLMLGVSLGTFCLGVALTTTNWLDDRFCMYILGENKYQTRNKIKGKENSAKLVVNGKFWNRNSARKILQFRAKFRRFTPTFALTSTSVGFLFFFYNFCFHSPYSVYEHPYHLFLLLVFLPTFTWCTVITAILTFYHFFIVTWYVHLKQSYLLEEQKRMIEKVKLTSKTSTSTFDDLHRNFTRLQAHLAYQCSEIGGLNSFWSLPLTILFIMEVVIICYLLYSCLFFEQQSAEQLIYFIFYVVELSNIIFGSLLASSRVDQANDTAYKGNVKLAALFQFKFSTGRGNSLQMLNIEKMATNRNFSQYCFRMVNGYRLDSTAFQMAGYAISTFFLMICRQNQRKLVGLYKADVIN